MVLELLPRVQKPDLQSYCYPIVLAHTSFKGLEVGLLLGAISGSLFSLYKTRRITKKNLAKFMNFGVFGGILFVDLMAYSRLSSSENSKNQSRAYRIIRNSKQNSMDNFTIGGMLIGHLAFRSLPIAKVMLLKSYVGGLLGFGLGAIYIRF